MAADGQRVGGLRVDIPVLIVCERVGGEGSFTAYLQEVLRTEGFTSTAVVTAARLSPALLETAGVVILYRVKGNGGIKELVTEYLHRGGGVLAICPGAPLEETFGVCRHGSTLAGGYWRQTLGLQNDLGLRNDEEALQFHTTAECWAAAPGSRVLGTLGPREQPDAWAAAVGVERGLGLGVALAFDPAEAVAFLRQGNPDWAGTEGDGLYGIRPIDMVSRQDGTKWNDPALTHLPQADLLQRFVVNLLYEAAGVPLPKLWYFPHGKRTVVGFVCDSDGATGEQIANQLMAVTAHDGEASVFMIDHSIERTDPVTVEEWRSHGHEIAVHPDYGRKGEKEAPDAAVMREVVGDIVSDFEAKFGYRPQTCRTHSGTWVGWVEQARIEREAGMRQNSIWTNWPHVGTRVWGGRPGGYLFGSGQPQRFVDEEGRLIDNYQACAHMTDQTLQTWLLSGDRLDCTSHQEAQAVAKSADPRVVMRGLTAEEAFSHTRSLVERSLAGHYSYLAFSFHPITYNRSAFSRRWQRDLLFPFLQKRGVSMWSMERILHFTDVRNRVEFHDMTWANGLLTFRAVRPPWSDIPAVLVPLHFRRQSLRTVAVDGRLQNLCERIQLSGREYVSVALEASRQVVEAFFA